MRLSRVYKKIFPIVKKTEGKCAYCGVDEAGQVDHIHPKSHGGSNEINNLVLACEKCNKTKHARPLEYLRDRLWRRKNNIPVFKEDQKEWLKSKGFDFPKNDFKFYFEIKKINIYSDQKQC